MKALSARPLTLNYYIQKAVIVFTDEVDPLLNSDKRDQGSFELSKKAIEKINRIFNLSGHEKSTLLFPFHCKISSIKPWFFPLIALSEKYNVVKITCIFNKVFETFDE